MPGRPVRRTVAARPSAGPGTSRPAPPEEPLAPHYERAEPMEHRSDWEPAWRGASEPHEAPGPEGPAPRRSPEKNRAHGASAPTVSEPVTRLMTHPLLKPGRDETGSATGAERGGGGGGW